MEQDERFEEMWETMGAEIKSACLRMLHVNPEYIVVISNPSEIVVAEDESELAVPLEVILLQSI